MKKPPKEHPTPSFKKEQQHQRSARESAKRPPRNKEASPKEECLKAPQSSVCQKTHTHIKVAQEDTTQKEMPTERSGGLIAHMAQ